MSEKWPTRSRLGELLFFEDIEETKRDSGKVPGQVRVSGGLTGSPMSHSMSPKFWMLPDPAVGPSKRWRMRWPKACRYHRQSAVVTLWSTLRANAGNKSARENTEGDTG